jgi:hypothetical protein
MTKLQTQFQMLALCGLLLVGTEPTVKYVVSPKRKRTFEIARQ